MSLINVNLSRHSIILSLTKDSYTLHKFTVMLITFLKMGVTLASF